MKKKYRALCNFTGVISMDYGCEALLDSDSEHTKVLVKAGYIEEVKKKPSQLKVTKREEEKE